MANTFLTPDMITRTALVILHQEAHFIGSINRQYDDSFAKAGAKIGDSLRIRLPNQYAVISGSTYSDVDQTEVSTTLTIDTWRQVPMFFGDADLSLKIQDFTPRFIQPATAAMAASLEASALEMVQQVYNTVDRIGNSITLREVLDAKVKMELDLCPSDGRWIALLKNQDQADLVNANKGLFQDASEISKQYKKGIMGVTGGYTFYATTLMNTHTSGTCSAVNNYTVNTSITPSATTPTTSIAFINNTGPQGTLKAGDVFTITGINKVHPETKTDLGVEQQFVVTADVSASSAPTVTFTPPVYLTGARQNVANTAFVGKAVVKVGAPSYVYKPSLFFHPDAFTFATADLELPRGVDMASRQEKDGISMRLVRDFDPVYSRMITRLDVLAGKKAIRPALAAQVLSL
jgi:hypothetical protein